MYLLMRKSFDKGENIGSFSPPPPLSTSPAPLPWLTRENFCSSQNFLALYSEVGAGLLGESQATNSLFRSSPFPGDPAVRFGKRRRKWRGRAVVPRSAGLMRLMDTNEFSGLLGGVWDF